jgi:hypothetical protein
LWNTAQGTGIVHDALVAFRSLLVDLAGDEVNTFSYVDTQETLQPDQWANELHQTKGASSRLQTNWANELHQTKGASSRLQTNW